MPSRATTKPRPPFARSKCDTSCEALSFFWLILWSEPILLSFDFFSSVARSWLHWSPRIWRSGWTLLQLEKFNSCCPMFFLCHHRRAWKAVKGVSRGLKDFEGGFKGIEGVEGFLRKMHFLLLWFGARLTFERVVLSGFSLCCAWLESKKKYWRCWRAVDFRFYG